MDNAIKLVLTTHDDIFAARELAQVAVEARLVACINIIPGLVSVFRWDNKIQTEDEVLMLCKTTEELLPQLKELIIEHHSYDVPELIEIDGTVLNEQYMDWINDCIK